MALLGRRLVLQFAALGVLTPGFEVAWAEVELAPLLRDGGEAIDPGWRRFCLQACCGLAWLGMAAGPASDSGRDALSPGGGHRAGGRG